MGRYFGTDGFRGEANLVLTADHAYKIGRLLGWYYGELKRQRGDNLPARIVIGKDTRRSSYMFEYALSAGITASGADAYTMHVTTTPSVAYITRVDEFDCGIMISASHNPYYDNGIKLLNSNGEKLDEATIVIIEDYLDGKLNIFGKKYKDLPFAHRQKIGRTVDYVSGRNRYIAYLISLGMYSFKGVKVGLDCANGSAFNIARNVFETLGAKVTVINAEPNGYNVNDNAGSTHIDGLCQLVKQKGLDIGFAYDGDADRCLAVDENGEIVTGDHILYICAKFMAERGELAQNKVVATVMSNLGLFKALDELNISHAQTAVGDRFVYEYMASNGLSLGGEQSGHIIFSKYATTGDGILTSLKIMEILMEKKTTLSRLCSPLKLYPQAILNVKVKDKNAVLKDESVNAVIEETKAKLANCGRVLVRKSGTEPMIRIMVEAQSQTDCNSFAQQIATAIQSSCYYRE